MYSETKQTQVDVAAKLSQLITDVNTFTISFKFELIVKFITCLLHLAN